MSIYLNAMESLNMSSLFDEAPSKKVDMTFKSGMTNTQIWAVLSDTIKYYGIPKGMYEVKRIKEGILLAYAASIPIGQGKFKVEHWNYHPLRSSLTLTHTTVSDGQGYINKALDTTIASLLRLYQQNA